MKNPYVMDSALIIVPSVLCSFLVFKLILNLRSTLPWRVNCWFCNSNFWIKYIERNSWTCKKCEQYNGFTKDGDYNKVLNIENEKVSLSPKLFQRSPPKNGLCKMCNINQQLKVTQLSNFVPMNENKYDEEVECYRLKLEKAYKLCSPCKKVLQMKLHKEKETLLGSKLLEMRTPEKKLQKSAKRNEFCKNVINNASTLIAGVLIVLVTVECYENALKHKSLSYTLIYIKDMLNNILQRIISIVRMKTFLTFPSLEKHFMVVDYNTDIFTNFNSGLNDLTQKALGGFVCFIQIVGHFWNINISHHSVAIDLLWSVFVITSIVYGNVDADPLIMSLLKLSSTLAVLLIYINMKQKNLRNVTRKINTPKSGTKLLRGTKSINDEEDNISLDTDDDVSLSKFGLHNFTDSSNDTLNPLSGLISGRSFTPRSDSLWSKPNINTAFTVNSALTNTPKSISDSVFMKPSFNKYQKIKDESDSDLDESINSLCISSPKKKSRKINPVFALRKFTASPNFIIPTPQNHSRPLISPSKLGHSTSWVAGGYWGNEGGQIFNVNGSRSSSQSSGFESQASSMNQRNVFSPPSREESVCGEPERTLLMDRFSNNTSTMNGFNYPNPSFTPIATPVFPQMQYNSHVQIPQPRFAQQTFVSQNVFAQQFSPNSTFKAPSGSRLIKLPTDSFAPR
ncbi:hypothetical protein KGM_209574 [Danaus plexippus plexippus]|uniref:Uncharacterized protein n=1 Tax=Danaus plexippus plexippus TaxID=278856 RepID=A0A212FET3_DANPL|nr:hypothetical protein KGM_209574 [Danaus plexippus plexippus]